MDVNTIGFPCGYKVYIDNVHMDAFIKSCYSSVDGTTHYVFVPSTILVFILKK